jgi:hypothetical protein
MSDKKRKSYLTIRFEGPEVRPGRMRLDDFIQAAREFSACAKRVALALQNIPSTTEGRRPKDVTESLSLDLVAFTEGRFLGTLTAEEYAEMQGVRPVADTAILYGDFAPEDWEGFDEALESWRT